MEKIKAILIYSGGFDSTTLLYEYKDDIEVLLHFQYGSIQNKKELVNVKYNARRLKKKLIVIDVKKIFKNITSSLITGNIPEKNSDDISSTIVPFRNGIFLSIAAGIADTNGCNTIFLATHFNDHEVYPDSRLGFTNSMKVTIQEGTIGNIKLVGPYNLIPKKEIAKRGLLLGVPYDHTWSCYRGGKTQCGKCPACENYIKALKEGQDLII